MTHLGYQEIYDWFRGVKLLICIQNVSGSIPGRGTDCTYGALVSCEM